MKRIFLVSDATREFDLRYAQLLDIESYLVIETNRVFPRKLIGRHPIIFLDDLFPKGELAIIRKHAFELEKNWFSSAENYFKVNGLILPDIDHHAMMWFWQTTLISTRFSEKILQSDYQIMSSHPNYHLPEIYYYPSDIFDTIFCMLIKDRYKKILYTEKKIIRIYRLFTSFLLHTLPLLCSSAIRNTTQSHDDYCKTDSDSCLYNQKDKIVIVLNAGEVYRFQGIIQKIAKTFANGVILLLFNSSKKNLLETKDFFHIPCFAIPISPASYDPAIISRFKNGVKKSISNIRDPSLKSALDATRYHFDYYCEKRWPELLQQYSFYLALFLKIKPRLVVGSALFDAESQLPIIAAKTTGIPTLCLPHGGFFYNTVLTNAEYVCYGSVIQKINFLNAGTDERNLFPCKDVLITAEYQSEKNTLKIFKNSSNGILKILVLTELTGHPTQLLRYIRPSLQKRAIQEISTIPNDLEPCIEIRIKTHPLIPDAGLFEFAGLKATSLLLPNTADLGDCLSDCDIIIALNYAGTALIHAINQLKPIIFFWNDSESYTFDDQYGVPRILSEAGILCTEIHPLWDCVRDLASDDAKKQALIQRVSEFKHNYVNNEDYPEIDHLISMILNSDKENAVMIHD